MPVVRTRSAARFEAGRGYPRLKWSDVDKSTIIANGIQIKKEHNMMERDVLKGVPEKVVMSGPSVGGKVPTSEWHNECHAILIHSDGESEQASSDNSLIYSDFHLSPESGKVRMAFTVPLTRLTSVQKCPLPVFQSTVQIKHSLINKVHEQEGEKEGGMRSGACVNSPKSPDQKKYRLFNRSGRPQGKTNPHGEWERAKTVRKPKYILKDPNGHSKPAMKFLQLDNATDTETYISPLVNPFNEQSLSSAEDQSSNPRPGSSWRDKSTGRHGCFAPLRNSLRDATFIILPSDSESVLGKEKGKSLKSSLSENESKSASHQHLIKPPLHVLRQQHAKGSLPSLRQWVSSEDPRKLRQGVGPPNLVAPPTPFEVRYYNERRPVPITITSASHSGLRCYPSFECHPSPEYSPFPEDYRVFPWHHCYHHYPTSTILPPRFHQLSPSHPSPSKDKHHSHRKNLTNPVGLTIRNRHAVMNSNDDLTSVRRDNTGPSPLQHERRNLSAESTVGQMGQRNSSVGGAPLSKRPSNLNSPSSAVSNSGTPKQSPAPSLGGKTGSTKGRKALKSSLRDTGVRKSLEPKSKPISSALSTNSPASFHGRVLHKTSTVSPGSLKAPADRTSTPLTRFGFKSSPLIASGESSDSVNSILSDAQITSESNSNIFHPSEENGNRNKSTDLITHSHVLTDVKDTDTGDLRGVSPCTISQASSGVTSTLLNGTLKAQTKQLPMPQIVTMKTMNNVNKSPSSNCTAKPRFSNLTPRKDKSPRKTPLATPKVSKLTLNSTKSEIPKIARVSRDSESSNKSLGTGDSGIGSSSESDKLRSSESFSLKVREKNEKKVHDEKAEVTENGCDLDVSDAWLREVRTQQEKKKSKDFDLKFKENVEPSSGSLTNYERPTPKESFKERRDSNITYGMARQKFAPYNRDRLTYHSSSSKSCSSVGIKSVKKDGNSSVKLNDQGTVRSRIAVLEKTPLRNRAEPTSQKPSKNLVARPTSIEKTRILVNSKTENTVELSRSIYKRLEYSQGKSGFLDSFVNDNTKESNLIEVPSTAQDLLMVDSFEVKKGTSPKRSNGNDILVDLPNPKDSDDDLENLESKRIQDISECENSTKRYSDSPKDSPQESKENFEEINTPLQLSLSEDDSKLFSPDSSEISFEVLGSGSTVISPKEEILPSLKRDNFVSQLVTGLSISSGESTPRAKHIQSSPSRFGPLKKCRQDSSSMEKVQEGKCVHEHSSLDRGVQSTSKAPQSESAANSALDTKNSMENSLDSSGCSDGNRMSDSCERWTISGKCTPTLSSSRVDADQDFLIDDEISDQPGLTFGDELEESFFGDDDLFSDISSPSASHFLPKADRSRHGSMGTASSVGGDDLMLDYDIEEPKQSGKPQPLPAREKRPKTSSKKPQGKISKYHDISIPGRRYSEEVLSPVACEILSEWSSILNDAQPASRNSTHSCVSQSSVGASGLACNVPGPSLSASPSTDINIHQPQSNTKDFTELATSISSINFAKRSRTASASPDFCTADVKKGVNFKPPRQGLPSEHDGGVSLDRTTLHYICQDVTAMKTLLLRLRRVIQVADTINPFDVNHKASLYLSLGANEPPEKEELHCPQDVVQQNVDLKRQVVLLQQRLEEKDRSIRILQQQLSLALIHSSSSCSPHQLESRLTASASSEGGDSSSSLSTMSNAATQTERFGHRSSPFSLTSMSRTSSVEDGLGPTVSSEKAIAKSKVNDRTDFVPTPEKEYERAIDSSKKKVTSDSHVAPPSNLSFAPKASVVLDTLAS